MINMKEIFVLSLCLILTCITYSLSGQFIDTLGDYTSEQWYYSDPLKDKTPGISLDKAYQYLAGRTGSKVLVAIIDSGFDTTHADIRSKLWVNPREITGNSIDDDGNGLPDDIHGWNYLGNNKGENLDGETLEMTRLYRQLRPVYGNIRASAVDESLREEHELYLAVKAAYEEEFDDANENLKQYQRMTENLSQVKIILDRHFRGNEYTTEDVAAIKTRNEGVNKAKAFYLALDYYGLTDDKLKELTDHYRSVLNTKLNLDHNPRHIIGDNILDMNDSIYGNNNLDGGTPGHGTSVAGVIAAIRNNGLGINGIANNIEIMIIRVVPGGDEYDKDVALGIRYAVNHGAKVINCSFGKEFSPQKWMVDSAIRYAEASGVLIVHGAGNDSEDNDVVNNFPTPWYDGGGRASNWIEVGASTKHPDRNLIASFSNYGKERVDLFAPGEDIITLQPGSSYKSADGTSLASPVVTGVAALLLSYFPDLTPYEVREIILQSVTYYGKKKVIVPGINKKVRMRNLCVSGGVLNAYNAVKMADERQKK